MRGAEIYNRIGEKEEKPQKLLISATMPIKKCKKKKPAFLIINRLHLHAFFQQLYQFY